MRLQVRGKVKTGQETLDTGIDDLIVVTGMGGPRLISASGPEGAIISYSLSNNQLPQITDQATYVANRASGTGITLVEYSDGIGTQILMSGVKSNAVMAYTLASDGNLSSQPNVTGTNFPLMTGADNDRIALANPAGDGFTVYTLGNGNALTDPRAVSDTADSHAHKINAMVTARIGGTDVLLVASRSEHGLSSYSLAQADPVLADTTGPDDGIGIMVPNDIEVVTNDGKTYAIVASSPSGGAGGALTVMEVDADGTLSPTDHILDTRASRFGKAREVEAITIDGHTYVVAGGGDRGLSLFELTPDGQLIHIDTIAGSSVARLRGITAIELASVGNELQVFVASQHSQGITVLKVELADRGVSRKAPLAGGSVSGTSDDDLLTGRDGNDYLSGGNGDDILVDGGGVDRMVGGAGADIYVLTADDRADRIDGFDPSEDRLDLSGWAFLYDIDALDISQTSKGAKITYRDEELTLNGPGNAPLSPAAVRAAITIDINRSFHPPSETLAGGAADDLLEGSWGTDTLTGGQGDDTLQGGKGDDKINGGEGTDTAVLNVSSKAFRVVGVDTAADRVTIVSADGRDVLISVEYFRFTDGTLDFDATLEAGGGPNPGETFIGTNSGNTLRGTGGDDRFFGRAGPDALTGREGRDMIDAGEGDDTLSGGDGSDRMNAHGGDDKLVGGSGNDTLDGGMGNDEVSGGDGEDRARLAVRAKDFSVIDFNLKKGTVTIGSEEGVDTYSGVEFFRFKNDTLSFEEAVDQGFKPGKTMKGTSGTDKIRGTLGNDFIFGRGKSDTIKGSDGRDVILGDGGNDRIHGDSRNDTISGGLGNDHLFGGSGNDKLYGSNGRDMMNGNSGRDRLFGGSGNDVLKGNTGRDRLIAEDGNDTLLGGGGKDNLSGGDGKDRLIGHSGKDRIKGGNGNDHLIGGPDDDDLTGGAHRDTLSGGGGNDRLNGSGGPDLLSGDKGTDRLDGGPGHDTLQGGGGNDTFVFAGRHGNDVIRDFNARSPHEKIDLRKIKSISDISDLTGPGGAAHQMASGVLIDTGDNSSILLRGVNLSDLDAGDFIF